MACFGSNENSSSAALGGQLLLKEKARRYTEVDMDISFRTDLGRFNYRVSAVILRDGCLLTVKDNAYSYSYLPGGRVKMGETAAEAMVRELREELRADLTVIRPIWFCEDFFTEEDTSEDFHEICLYYLVDGSSLPKGDFCFEEDERLNHFSWSKLDQLKETRLYPEFVKERIGRIPDGIEMVVEEKH